MSDKHLVEIVGRGGTGQTGRLVIDGHDVSSAVTELQLVVSAQREHSLTVQLVAFPVIAHMEGVKVRVDNETAEVLTWLGWTPPPEEEKADALD